MKKWKFAFLLCLISAFLFGCHRLSNQATEVGEKKDDINYSEKQMTLLVLSKMEEIQLAFGSEIWEKELDNKGLTYREEFLGEMQEFFIEMRTLNMIAKEKGVRLTTEEETKVGKLAGDFFENLASNPNFDSEISHEEVDSIFKEYALAQKTKVEVTREKVDSISENDARILNLQQIVLASEDAVEKVKSELSAEKADFFTIARQNSTVSAINIEVGHEDMNPEADRIVCELENGEISDPILIDGNYYIYKCVEGYNIDATARKKKEMKIQAMEAAMKEVYAEYQSRNPLNMNSEIWNQTVQKVEEKYPSLKSDSGHIMFFTLYRENLDFMGF